MRHTYRQRELAGLLKTHSSIQDHMIGGHSRKREELAGLLRHDPADLITHELGLTSLFACANFTFQRAFLQDRIWLSMSSSVRSLNSAALVGLAIATHGLW